MEQRRFILFILISIVILVANFWLQALLRGPEPPQKPPAPPPAQQAADKPADVAPPADEQPGAATRQPDVAVAEAAEAAPQWFTLGSVDPSQNNPYRLLVTLTNRGAAVERIELSSERYRDLEDRTGYLGNLVVEPADGGVKVNVVPPGSPAAAAGLQAGDVLQSVAGSPVADPDALAAALRKTRPRQAVELTFHRGGQTQSLSTTLARRPLEVVRPEFYDPKTAVAPFGVSAAVEQHDPLSFLMTLFSVDHDQVAADKVDAELAGVRLRSAHWQGSRPDADTVEFTRPLPALGLEVVKRYRIATDQAGKPAYYLTLEVEVRNVGQARRTVAYQLDGPTGLPIEGWWYTARVSREWSGAGIRDVCLLLQGKSPAMISPMQLVAGDLEPPFRSEDAGQLLAYAGVDAQYFACAFLPAPFRDRPVWLAQIKGILVGAIPPDPRYQTLTNLTCRLVSVSTPLEPGGEPLKHSYTVFAGPKRPELLVQFGDEADNLSELIYFGWPIWAAVARPMTKILHFFYSIVGNYGIAIVLLTVVVRGCMFPLSRKQAMAAQKMQELKPEMDRINEKYKGKPEERTRATQELWRKHNYNPFAGCFLVFLQLPIFIGLYRALMIDVELRQAPLLGESIAWCSNLAAPDMLAYWRDWPFMPSFLTAYKGFLSLGPYLNILPLVTVGLFIWQQKMFMPPATDDQTRMQQSMMKYMMVLMGFLFFTVPSGLCIYFIASSIWGIAERKLLPKSAPAGSGAITPKPGASSGGNGAASRRDRKRQGK